MEEEKKFKALVRLTGKEVTVTPVQDSANQFRTLYRSEAGNVYTLEELDMRYEPSEEESGGIDIKDAVEAMYYHTAKANLVWWAMAGTVLAFRIAGLTGTESAAWAIASLILALLQNVWQGTALECFVRQLDKQGKTRFDTYPDHISNGGWAFYILKMLAALIALATMVAGWII